MKYWAYINNEIVGPHEKEKLLELPFFNASTLIYPQTAVGEKNEDWKEASAWPEIAALMKPQQGPNPLAASQPISPANPMAQTVEIKPAQEKQSPQAEQTVEIKPAEKTVEVKPVQALNIAEQTVEIKPVQLPVQQQEVKIETTSPLFNSEPPETKLKPMALHDLEQAPPEAKPAINANIDSKRLGQAAKVQPQSAPETAKQAGINFEPLSLSDIQKQADKLQQSGAKPLEFEVHNFNLPEQPVASIKPVLESTIPQTPPVTPGEARSVVPDKDFQEIKSRLESLISTSVSKEDLRPIKENIARLEILLENTKNPQVQPELLEKLQQLETSVNEVKEALTKPKAALSGRTERLQNEPENYIKPTSMSESASLQAASPKTTQIDIVDQGSKQAKSKGGGKVVKIFMSLLLAGAALGGGAFALKHFKIFDVTQFLPGNQAALNANKNIFESQQAMQASGPGSEQQVPGSGEPGQQPDSRPEQVQAQEGLTTAENNTATGPQKPEKEKDMSPEIIYITRTYTIKPGGDTLENKIYADAASKKGDYNKTTWKVKETKPGLFEIICTIPLKTKQGQLNYKYEVDYAQKSVRALDKTSKTPMDLLLRAETFSKGMRSKKTGTNKESLNAMMIKTQNSRQAQLQNQVKSKPAATKTAKPATEDEYEYVYEDEAGAPGAQ